MTCEECGGEDCQAAFDQAMALELSQSEFGAVHHLTVSAFMVQHPSRLSEYGWHREATLLREFVAGVTPEVVLRRPRTPGPSVVRGDSIDPLRVSWSRTIRDVGFGDAPRYRADVRSWAAAVVADLDQPEERVPTVRRRRDRRGP